MQQFEILRPKENPSLDSERLSVIYDRLGTEGGDKVICRVMEELAVRLTRVEHGYSICDSDLMRRNLRAVIAVSEQLGMPLLAQVSKDVVKNVDGAHEIALSATLARLLRVADSSLTEIWDLQDLSI